MHAANWHPLTWISHEVDASLFGVNPAGHHATSVLLHIASALLLYGLLRALPETRGAAPFIAAVFLVHPVRVESVAWVAERKDVLCGLLSLAAIAFWVRWVRKPGAARYTAALVCFAAALMAKPMAVTLPLLLLVLDWWPLRRMQGGTPPLRLLTEKLPFFALCAVSSVLTVKAQQAGGALRDLDSITAGSRVANALVSTVDYLRMTFWPSGLAVFYPHPEGATPGAWAALAAVLLAALTAGAILLRRSHPYLLAGWLWFLMGLLPVIGLVQVGAQARADRYLYLPQLGLIVAIALGGAALLSRAGAGVLAARAAAIVVVLALSLAAVRQVGYWKTSVTLFERAIAVTGDNWFATYNLGQAVETAGDRTCAEQLFRETLRINPKSGAAANSLGGLLIDRGAPAEAVPILEAALKIRPRYGALHNNLGLAYLRMGRETEAIPILAEASQLIPDDALVCSNLGVALATVGRLDEARTAFEEGLRRDPQSAEAHYNLGRLFQLLGKPDLEAQHLREALRLRPGDAEAAERLRVLAAQGL